MLKKIGKYEIIAELGRGAMGVVYEARDPLIGRMVALKVITGGQTNRPELLDRFYQEARSAGALQHPNIVTVYELGNEADLPFIAMEYLGGVSLEKIIARRTPMPLAHKVGYVAQICRALEYAHKHGVVHRDIKPGNIMETAEGAVKVVDFGIARLVDASKTQTGTLIGTLGYMSPQQLRGEHADERSDIWAVGVLFYELLSYARPFRGDNPAALMMSIISKAPPPLVAGGVDCSAELEAIVFRMLEKEAADRYQTMDDVLLSLDPVWKSLQQARVTELVAESHRQIEADDFKHAHQLLREALHSDSSNPEAKSLLEKVSKELRRQQVLPKLKDQVGKARELLDAGRLQEAKSEVESALRLDSTFAPARGLLEEVESAARRVRELDQRLRATEQSIATGALTDADRRLDDLLALDPENPRAQELRQQIREEVNRREQRKRLSEALRHARDLWSQLSYSDCIQELLELQREFPGNAELDKLLETARRDQADAERQKKLAAARNLLAGQQYEEAYKALAELQKDFPQDAAIENLLKLAAVERGIAAQQQRLQRELASLRSLASQGKHGEALRGGEQLLKEYPGEFELVELVKFLRAESRRGEQALRLDQAVRRTRQLFESGAFTEAAREAAAALKEFPGNGELASLAEQVHKKKQEQRHRDQIEKRIRDVKTRIEQDELTGAIELARETIATLGPDTHVSRLLEAAEGEWKQRAKEKEQDQKVQDARSFLEDGKVDEATQTLDQALATRLLDAGDPRVKTFLVELENRKQERTPGASRPPESNPPPDDRIVPEPALAATMLVTPTEGQPAAAAAEAAPEAARPVPAETRRRPSRAAQPAANQKRLLMVGAGVAIAALIGAGVYFGTRRAKTPSAVAARHPIPPPPIQPKPAAPPTAPVVSQLEQQQRQLIAKAEQLAGQGKFPEALDTIGAALQLHGPLQQNATALHDQFLRAEQNRAARAAIETETRLWSQAVAAYWADKLDAATRGFQQVASLGPGMHRVAAGLYLNRLIPQARKSDQLFLSAQALSRRTNDRQSLTQADQDLVQVIDAGGPRAGQASRLQASLQPLVSAWGELQQLLKTYNRGNNDASQLRQLQSEFRGLERVKGTVGREARLVAEQRIPLDLKAIGTKAAARTPAPAPLRHPWVVIIDSSSVSGLRLERDPLPSTLAEKAAASHARFQLQLSINSGGRVTGGRVLSATLPQGKPSGVEHALADGAAKSWQALFGNGRQRQLEHLGEALVKEAKRRWRFSPPARNKASATVSVRF
ncbi:MAG: protein kinase domain-containing protein [Terriglobales bacterium]